MGRWLQAGRGCRASDNRAQDGDAAARLVGWDGAAPCLPACFTFLCCMLPHARAQRVTSRAPAMIAIVIAAMI